MAWPSRRTWNRSGRIGVRSIEILKDLVAFETVSGASNIALLDYVVSLLSPACMVETFGDKENRKNLFLTIGPNNKPGIVLSAHSDVVAVTNQTWSRDPFTLFESGDRLYGRGTADMKGFLACAIACAEQAVTRQLATPLHLAISYDEEIGCVGVHSMLAALSTQSERPLLCLVGEPTSMRVATGHKGKVGLRATCTGRPAHSALPFHGLNAIHLASDFIQSLRKLQSEIAAEGNSDTAYDVPYSTIHVGMMRGGEALNIVPGSCTVDFEIRNIAADDIDTIIAAIETAAIDIVAPLRRDFPEASISLEQVSGYPGLDTQHDKAVRFVASLTGSNDTDTKLAFGTEGGLFSKRLNTPTLICGPGSMDQGHKPDEFISREQMARCDAMLARLLDRLEEGITL